MTAWTRDDLPSVMDLVKASVDATAIDPSGGADAALDAVVAHLNAHHPKPQPFDQGGVRGADSLLYRAERAERERDAAVARAEQAENARDTATTRAEQLEREIKRLHKVIDEKVREANESADYQEQIDAELRSAGVRVELTDPPTVSVPAVIPPVSRADVAEALARCLNPEMWNVTFPAVVNEICDLFGVEAEQAVDPVEAKAKELWEVAKPSANATWSGTNELAKEQFRKVAAHVLGQEAGDE